VEYGAVRSGVGSVIPGKAIPGIAWIFIRMKLPIDALKGVGRRYYLVDNS
jgi:hypothetical protein